MAYTATPEIVDVIHEARREITMSVEIDDGAGDVRTVTGTGKAKTQAEGKHLMDGIIAKYHNARAREAVVVAVKEEMEGDAKTYLEAELNG